ncbi:agmatinase [Methanolacinia paynteri]|uniref:agmatinase n=1 Tax=Methanolacinia paynteri TaxID=230356 RepID=UPI00064EA12B|nr:agmatinase [Methanolacinia paynteri]
MENFFHTIFADASYPYEDSDIIIFGVPYDGTTSYKAGTRDAPDAIRNVSYNFETYLPRIDLDLSGLPVCDLGNLEIDCLPDLVIDQVERTVREIAGDDKFPVMIGGEHSVTLGAVRALSPECYIVCDAHLDLREEFGGSIYNHACVAKRVLDLGVGEVFIIGARSGTVEEYGLARSDSRISIYSPEDIAARGLDDVLDEIRGKTSGKRTYLSIDADAIDCCLTPGLGTPEPFGLRPEDIRAVVDRFGTVCCGFDYVEVCPIDDGQTAAVAAKIIRELIGLKNKK